MGVKATLGLGLLFALSTSMAQEPPRDLGIEEHVDVQFVLLDFLVLDRRDRTVPDLTTENFSLKVGGRPVEIASLDVHCPIGAMPDPRGGQTLADSALEHTQMPDRRFVLVFDYYHMEHAATALRYAAEGIRNWELGGEQLMVVGLAEVMHVETPFTDDKGEILQALERMVTDPVLYAGNYGRLTERRFYRRVQALMDVLQLYPGKKSVVLFSGPFIRDGFFYDGEYKKLGALAARSRTAIYPVDTTGLNTIFDYGYGILGGPEQLRRLANVTGGRMTADNNDLALGYARAQRDSGCTYTMGFYDRKPRLDENRRVSIRIDGRPGTRAVHPTSYVVRSTKKKRKSLLYTASMSPEMFPSDTITTKLFLMEPRSTTRWDGILGVEIRPEPQEYSPSAEPLVLTIYVRSRSGAVLKRFTREIARPLGDTVEPVTVFEAVKIAPGTHIVSAVLSDPTRAEPIAATQRIDIPAIPHNELFMVGPVLGTPSEDEEFVPLVWGDATRGAPLAALTRICYVGGEMETDEARLARLVRAEGGALTESFDTIAVRLASEGRIRCTRQVDWVSTAALAPGTYNLVAFSGSEDRVLGRGNAAFTILP